MRSGGEYFTRVQHEARLLGYRVVAQFISGELSKTAQTVPDWAAKVFGKELHVAKPHEKAGRGR